MVLSPGIDQDKAFTQLLCKARRIVPVDGQPAGLSGPSIANVPMMTWPPGLTACPQARDVGQAVRGIDQK